jgi:CDP-6-deoxy-D-xylo-4-hexulose-3-dehydrase
MSTIEGGMVCTDNEEISTMARIVRAHGWDRNLSLQKQKKIRRRYNINSSFYSRYTFYDLGFNLRPTEINGFLGNFQLQFISEIVKKRNENFLKIAKIIYKNQNYYPLKYNHIDFVSNFAVPIVCKSQSIRDKLVEKCKDKIEIRPIVGGDMTKQPFFSKYQKIFTKILKDSNSRLIHEQGLYFGNNPELTEEEIKKLIEVFA